MKLRLTTDDLAQLTPEQQEKLRLMWQQKEYDVYAVGETEASIRWDNEKIHPDALPLLSIGQLLQLLADNIHTINYKDNIWDIKADEQCVMGTELIEVLWRVVKRML
jgi:hypothetical protein